MKTFSMFAIAVLLIGAGCVYDAPLTKEHTISIDPKLIGAWEYVEEEDESSPDQKMLILKFSETEYAVHYPATKDGLYYRGYPVKVGGVDCVQLKVIGSKNGKPDEDDTLYLVARYKLEKDEMVMTILNTALVSGDLKGSAAIKEAFLKHAKDEKLFAEPGRFKRMEK